MQRLDAIDLLYSHHSKCKTRLAYDVEEHFAELDRAKQAFIDYLTEVPNFVKDSLQEPGPSGLLKTPKTGRRRRRRLPVVDEGAEEPSALRTCRTRAQAKQERANEEVKIRALEKKVAQGKRKSAHDVTDGAKQRKKAVMVEDSIEDSPTGRVIEESACDDEIGLGTPQAETSRLAVHVGRASSGRAQRGTKPSIQINILEATDVEPASPAFQDVNIAETPPDPETVVKKSAKDSLEKQRAATKRPRGRPKKGGTKKARHKTSDVQVTSFTADDSCASSIVSDRTDIGSDTEVDAALSQEDSMLDVPRLSEPEVDQSYNSKKDDPLRGVKRLQAGSSNLKRISASRRQSLRSNLKLSVSAMETFKAIAQENRVAESMAEDEQTPVPSKRAPVADEDVYDELKTPIASATVVKTATMTVTLVSPLSVAASSSANNDMEASPSRAHPLRSQRDKSAERPAASPVVHTSTPAKDLNATRTRSSHHTSAEQPVASPEQETTNKSSEKPVRTTRTRTIRNKAPATAAQAEAKPVPTKRTATPQNQEVTEEIHVAREPSPEKPVRNTRTRVLRVHNENVENADVSTNKAVESPEKLTKGTRTRVIRTRDENEAIGGVTAEDRVEKENEAPVRNTRTRVIHPSSDQADESNEAPVRNTRTRVIHPSSDQADESNEAPVRNTRTRGQRAAGARADDTMELLDAAPARGTRSKAVTGKGTAVQLEVPDAAGTSSSTSQPDGKVSRLTKSKVRKFHKLSAAKKLSSSAVSEKPPIATQSNLRVKTPSPRKLDQSGLGPSSGMKGSITKSYHKPASLLGHMFKPRAPTPSNISLASFINKTAVGYGTPGSSMKQDQEKRQQALMSNIKQKEEQAQKKRDEAVKQRIEATRQKREEREKKVKEQRKQKEIEANAKRREMEAKTFQAKAMKYGLKKPGAAQTSGKPPITPSSSNKAANPATAVIMTTWRQEEQRRREQEEAARIRKEVEEARQRREYQERLRAAQQLTSQTQQQQQPGTSAASSQPAPVKLFQTHQEKAANKQARTTISNDEQGSIMNAVNTSILNNSQSYEMTPKAPKTKGTDSNYDIGDLASGDETDDEDNPRKKIPLWAQGTQFKAALVQQYYCPPPFDLIAAPFELPILEKIFKKKRARFDKRTSSAIWDTSICIKY